MYKKDYYDFVNNLLEEYLSNMIAAFDVKYIFICGGAENNSKRNQFKRYFEENYKDSGLTLVYAENFAKVRYLFSDKDDLLSLENFLSEFCACILIFLESAGSLTELGAFSNRDDLLSKILIVNEYKNKGQTSFINDGPIKKVENNSVFGQVIFYHDNYFLESVESIISRIEGHTKQRDRFIRLSDCDFSKNRVYKICLIVKLLGILSPVTKVEALKILKRIKVFKKSSQDNEFYFDFVLSMGWFKIVGGEKGYIVPLHSFNDFLKERTSAYKLYNYRAKIIKYYKKNDLIRLKLIKNSIDNKEDYLNLIDFGK